MKARTLIALLMVALLLLVGYIPARNALVGNTALAASPPCAVTYQLNQWSTGFTAQLQITNNSAATTGWTLTWTFSGNQLISSAWNAQLTQTGTAVTAKNLSYNGSLPTGGSVQFGFQATFSGINNVPTDFALNGTSCGGIATTTPTVGATATVKPTATVLPTATMIIPVTPTPTPTPASGGSCAKALFCDGFENQAGSVPSGAWQVSYPNCQGTGTASVDHTIFHNGSTSIRVNGYNGYCNHVFFGIPLTIAGLGSDLYVRYFVRHTTALPVTHVTDVAMRDANDGGNDLRMGGQNSALQWNRQSDDATLPAQSPAGVALSVPLPTNQWSCVEFEVNQAQGTMSTWLNGNEVAGLHLDNVPTPDVDAQWLQNRPNWRPALTDLRFGWESYSGGDDTLWFDDIAIGSQRVGCS